MTNFSKVRKKKCDTKLKQKILTEIALDKKNKEDIAKSNHISLHTLYNLYRDNQDLYRDICSKIRERLNARSLLTAERCVKRIKKDKIDNSSGLQLTQMAQNLVNLNKNDSPSVNIQINLPDSKEELIKIIANAGNEPIKIDNVIGNSINNEK